MVLEIVWALWCQLLHLARWRSWHHNAQTISNTICVLWHTTEHPWLPIVTRLPCSEIIIPIFGDYYSTSLYFLRIFFRTMQVNLIGLGFILGTI
jgi:hypothetical protein